MHGSRNSNGNGTGNRNGHRNGNGNGIRNGDGIGACYDDDGPPAAAAEWGCRETAFLIDQG